MKLWTIQMGQWRNADRLGIPMVNTTVMSGLSWLAPTWDMVKGHKLGIYSDADYTAKYIPMMTLSECDHRDKWLEIAQMDQVALACYCKAGAFCHRRLLVGMFRSFCEREGIEFTYMGELTKETTC